MAQERMHAAQVGSALVETEREVVCRSAWAEITAPAV
jgi:hypothetical protein